MHTPRPRIRSARLRRTGTIIGGDDHLSIGVTSLFLSPLVLYSVRFRLLLLLLLLRPLSRVCSGKKNGIRRCLATAMAIYQTLAEKPFIFPAGNLSPAPDQVDASHLSGFYKVCHWTLINRVTQRGNQDLINPYAYPTQVSLTALEIELPRKCQRADW